MKIIGFLSHKLTLRGTEIAMYDYADYNESLLNNKSIIITKDYKKVRNENDVNINAYIKFKKRFIVEYYEDQSSLDQIIDKYNISFLYIIKINDNDTLISTKCKNLIHTVFNSFYKHGDVYSVISDDVNIRCNTTYPVVPHMIRVANSEQNLRNLYNIPNNAIVFGRYGGIETFDIQFVHKCIKQILREKENVYFLFMNTKEFYRNKNIIYLPGTTDMIKKREFINTCDAMIHARLLGESFGLACGEFSVCNKPVITYAKSDEKNHLYILKDSAILYSNIDELFQILYNFEKNKYNVQNNGYHYYSPSNVMNIFNEIFLLDN